LALRDELIAPEDVAIYFFRQESGVSTIKELALDRYGNLSAWPEGFFDQAERDLAALGGWA
jgi:predicted ATPase